MKYIVLSPARDEFREGTLRYKAIDRALAVRFRNEVHRVIKRIVADPLLWRERPGGYRRVNCPVFPYYVAYIIRATLVVVVAVAHSHRHPDFWKKRLS
jgi:plasmid stabilization system protein ParE